jgi:hypothetical protein
VKPKRVRKKRVVIKKPEIATEMMDSFREWAGDKKTIQRRLMDKLDQQELRDEGDGWFQKGFTYTGEESIEKRQIKIRYNPSQKLLKVYIRGYEYAA